MNWSFKTKVSRKLVSAIDLVPCGSHKEYMRRGGLHFHSLVLINRNPRIVKLK